MAILQAALRATGCPVQNFQQPDFDMSRFYAAPGDDEMIGDNLQA